MTKTKKAWGIMSGKILLPYSIRSTRKQAISDFLEFTVCPDVKTLICRGHTVVKVTVTYEVKK